MKAGRFLFCFVVLLCSGFDARAREISLISDEETERALYSFQRPLFKAAGLDASSLKIRLVKDDDINAFATAGGNVFIHTGLLLKADNAQEVIAVLAHETGHVSGGHIARLYENMRIAQRNMLITMILGAAAAAAGGGDLGAAVMTGGMSSANGLLAGYRRTEENAADQAAVSLLRATGHDLSGFRGIMKKLSRQESWQAEREASSLWRTHPMVRERLAFILSKESAADETFRPDQDKIRREDRLFERVQAKLFAFLEAPERTFERYPVSDDRLPARYARAIADYRRGRFKEAADQTDALIRDYPSDPYFYELKGQIFFETGRAAQALPAYEKAVSLLPDSVLMRIGLAQAQIEADTPETLRDAVKNLEYAAGKDTETPAIRRLQAIAYGRTGREGLAAYAMAEYFFLLSDRAKASAFARKASALLSPTSAAGIRTSDILAQLGAEGIGKTAAKK